MHREPTHYQTEREKVLINKTIHEDKNWDLLQGSERRKGILAAVKDAMQSAREELPGVAASEASAVAALLSEWERFCLLRPVAAEMESFVRDELEKKMRNTYKKHGALKLDRDFGSTGSAGDNTLLGAMKVPLHTLLRGVAHEKLFELKEGQSDEDMEHTYAMLVQHYTDEDETFRAAATGKSIARATQSSGSQGSGDRGEGGGGASVLVQTQRGGNDEEGLVGSGYGSIGGGVKGKMQGGGEKLGCDSGEGKDAERHRVQEQASAPEPSASSTLSAHPQLHRASTFKVDARVHAPVLHRGASSMKMSFARPTAETKSSHEQREEQWRQDYRRTKAVSSVVDTLAQHAAHKRAAAELRVGSFQQEQDIEPVWEEEGSGSESDEEGENGKTAGTGEGAAGASCETKRTKASTHKISAFRQYSAREHAAVCALELSPSLSISCEECNAGR